MTGDSVEANPLKVAAASLVDSKASDDIGGIVGGGSNGSAATTGGSERWVGFPSVVTDPVLSDCKISGKFPGIICGETSLSMMGPTSNGATEVVSLGGTVIEPKFPTSTTVDVGVTE